jgi:ABC-type uncharacterized transport system substrate-binding protein
LCAREIVILNSGDIIPYTSCIEGIREALPGFSLQLITIEQDLDKGSEVLQKLKNPAEVFVIAVGPQAAYIVSRAPQLYGRVFCMVLNPRKLLPGEAFFPGVSLNIPPRLQMQTINDVFPDRGRIGIFYNAQTNQELVDEYIAEARQRDLTVVGFPIAAASDVPARIKSERFDIDVLLFVPDEVLNTTKMVEYIIGALLSFIIDYRSVGGQTAAWARTLLARPDEGPASVAPPEVIKISIDLKTARKLGIHIAPGMLERADEVIR